MTHPAVTPISQTATGPNSWIGEVKADESIGLYFDQVISVILGAIPWQVSLQKASILPVMCYIPPHVHALVSNAVDVFN